MEQRIAVAYKRKPRICKRLVLAPGEEVTIPGIGTIQADENNSSLVYIGKDLSIRSEVDMDSIRIYY